MDIRKAFALAVMGAGLLGAQAGTSGDVYKVGNGISAPRLIFRADPEYTPEAQAAKIDGAVLLSIVVGTDGLAHDINVVKGLGSGLDEKAVQAVQKWKFEPGLKDGAAVNVRAQIEINFRLK